MTRLPVEEMHQVVLAKGVSKCTKCGAVEPDLRQPCPASVKQDDSTFS